MVGGGLKVQVGGRENGKRVSAHSILGARGLGEVEDGWGRGKKQNHQGFREQRPETWGGGSEEQLAIQASVVQGPGEPA